MRGHHNQIGTKAVYFSIQRFREIYRNVCADGGIGFELYAMCRALAGVISRCCLVAE